MTDDPDAAACRIRKLAPDDIVTALELCRAAGWNQTRLHWQTLIEFQPLGCFAAVIGNQLVGTVTTTRFGNDLAWIGMMLVDRRFRRRGIARSLMNTALHHLRQQRVRCIKLDATPEGEAVYEKLGFQREFEFSRWERSEPAGPTRREGVPHPGSLDEVHRELDKRAFGADRWSLLKRLANESTIISQRDGYGMLRKGHVADYVGPVVAVTPTAARRIVNTLLDLNSTRAYWDVSAQNPTAVDLARSLGFQPKRQLTRMWTGDNEAVADPDLQYALADPSIG